MNENKRGVEIRHMIRSMIILQPLNDMHTPYPNRLGLESHHPHHYSYYL